MPFRLALILILAPLAALAQGAPDYVGSETCAECHSAEAEAWAGSHHDLAWTETGEPHLLADMDGTRFAHDGTLSEFALGPDGPEVTVTEADGSSMSWPIHSVVGIAPLQQYLIETEPGRLQSFDVVWDTEERHWFHLYPDQHLTPADGLHWTGPYKNWNARCAECHATGFQKGYDPRSQSYGSSQAEIGVGCEACHGPGAAHLAWTEGTAPGQGLTDMGLTIDLAQGGETLIQQCATCHSRREPFGTGNPLPGTAYHDNYRLSLLRPGLYEPDGQIRDEVYVYGSFLQSKMYAKGVACADCHDAHSAQLVTDGNAICTQCHSPAGNDRFPSLPLAEYDSPAHHHHEAGAEGAQCVSCHMVDRVYMGNDWRRDHSFRVPRPDLGASLGTPDACTDCHQDRGAPWAAATLEAWFPDSRHRGAHFASILAAGRADAQAAWADLAALALDDSQPEIVRATALEMLPPVPDAGAADRLAPLLAHPSPLIRAQATRAQRGAPDQDRVLRLLPLLEDPTRAVRIATVRELLTASSALIGPGALPPLRSALGEWQQNLRANADFPETQMILAGVALTQRNLAAADAAFAEALRLDPQMRDAWMMRARLALSRGDQAGAEALLRAGLAALPGDGELGAALAGLTGDLLPPQ